MQDEKPAFHMPLLDDSNFSAWKFRITVLLEEHELLECVQSNVGDLEELKEQPGEKPEDKTTRLKTLDKRVKKDRHCRAMLITRIGDSQLEYLHDTTSPKDIWDKLHSIYERRSIAKRMQLKRELVTLRYEGGKLQQHFLNFDRLIREYRSTGAVLDEIEVIIHLLLTMGTAFSTVVTALETMAEDNLSLEFVKCRLLDEETKRKGMDVPTPAEKDAAFHGAKPPKKLKCFGCNKEGHKVADCPEKKTKQQRSKKKPHSKANVAETGDQKAVCFLTESNPQKERTRWFIDSGATDHLVRDKNLFSELRPLKEPIEIAVAKDGEAIQARHSGTVKVVAIVNNKKIDCTIENALYVPKLRCNLFSVWRVNQAGMRVVFEAGEAKIYSGSEIVACATVKDKLYEMNFLRHNVDSSSLLTCGRLRKGFDLWHRRYGHLNEQSLKCLVQKEMVSGLDLNTTGADDTIVCESCVVGKQSRKPFSSREGRRSSRVLELIHTDVCGPVSPEGLDGKKYFVTFIDDWSHFTVVYLLSSKDEVAECFEEYEAFVVAKFERPISRLKCDNGGEYRNKRFEKFCKTKGIQLEPTVPYTPEQNGLSERMNRTLVEKARAMLTDSGVDRKFWGQAVQTAAYLTNRSPTAALEMKRTPFELWESKKPDVSNIRVFGCDVFVHVPKELRRKLDDKAWKGTFVGYSHNGYRVWNPTRRTIVTARDVDFVEAALEPKQTEDPVKQFVAEPTKIVELENDDVTVADDNVSHASEESSDEDFSSFIEDDPEPNEDQNGNERPQRTRSAPVWHKDFEVEYAGFALNAMNFIDDIPSSVAELKKRSDWQKWKAAMNEEMASMKRNNTWTLVELPKGRKAVTCKWVFKVKHGDAEKPDRFKARLVARGFTQKHGFDYTETYSPVAKLDTLRAVLALANENRMYVHQMDVKTAFLNGELAEEIYMTQPEEFQQGNGLVCKLNRSIYGLKQASRAWNDRFHGFISKLGFVRSANDFCLYTRGTGDKLLILVLYVDDIVLAGSSLKTLEEVKQKLAAEFEMTDEGEIKQFLGMRFERDRMAGVLKINQRDYFDGLLKRFGMEDCKPISTPMENRLRLEKGDEKQRTSKPYRELVGCLTYASLTTRPDLAAAVNYFSQFQSCSTEEHWVHLKRILRYIKGTLDVGLVYKAVENPPLLEVYSDADWANDSTDRRSVTGCVVKMLGCTVGWLTRKQQTVSLSSTEAELAALCTATCHTLWMMRLLDDLGKPLDGPVPMYEDNQSTIRIAEDFRDCKRLKHVDTKFHFLRELVQQDKIVIKFVRSAEQQADIMTKGLPAAVFKDLRAKLGLEMCCV